MNIKFSEINKNFGSHEIFKDLSLQINEGEKICIFGKNGQGKSTLLKMIMEQEDYDGAILGVDHANLGYFDQHLQLNFQGTVEEFLKETFKESTEIKNKINSITDEINQGIDLEKNIEKLSMLNNKLDSNKEQDKKIKYMEIVKELKLLELGDKHLDLLSGGEKCRVALGKILIAGHDLLLLDEPLNHLDLNMTIWLERFLRTFKGTIILVCHDRELINNVCTHTAYINNRKIHKFKGGYEEYKEQKNLLILTAKRNLEKEEEIIKREEQFIEKNLTRASTTKRAQSRRKKLAKMEKTENIFINDKDIQIDIKYMGNTPMDLITCQNLEIGYEERLCPLINLEIVKETKMGIFGSNGAGKSTLVKTLLGQVSPLGGTIKIHELGKIVHMDQSVMINSEETLEDFVHERYKNLSNTEIYGLLGRFLFTEDQFKSKVNKLSGGEKMRIQLMELLQKESNILILDEPTNHLDMESKEALEEALIKYQGSVIFISHDRYFLKKISNKLLFLSKDKVEEINLEFNEFPEIEKLIGDFKSLNDEESSLGKLNLEETEKREIKPQINDYERRKELSKVTKKREKVEGEIEKFEDLLKEKEELLYSGLSEDLLALHKEVENLKGSIKEIYEDYENLLLREEELTGL